MTILTIARDKETVDSGEYDAAQVFESLLYAIVCHRVDLDSVTAIDATLFMSGTSGGWQYVARDALPEGWWEGEGAVAASPTEDGHDAPYPQPCNDHPETHVHVLAAC